MQQTIERGREWGGLQQCGGGWEVTGMDPATVGDVPVWTQ
jgi:hypothetical protein